MDMAMEGRRSRTVDGWRGYPSSVRADFGWCSNLTGAALDALADKPHGLAQAYPRACYRMDSRTPTPMPANSEWVQLCMRWPKRATVLRTQTVVVAAAKT